MRISYKKKILPFLMIIAIALSLTACWDHVEISEMLTVAGIGIDVDDAGKIYHATVEIVNVESAGEKSISAEIVEGDGATMHSAIQNAVLMTGGTMFSNHCKVIVIGDTLARNGVNEIIDMILRSPNFRKTVDILIAKDTKAEDILKQKTIKNDIVSYELSKILESNVKNMSVTVDIDAYQIHEILVPDSAYFLAPVVFSRPNNGEDRLEIAGGAVFAQDRLQGFLDEAQCKLFNMVTGNVTGAEITIENTALSERPIDVIITKSDTKLTPGLLEDRLFLTAEVMAEATLKNSVLLETDFSDNQTMELMRQSLNEELSDKIEGLITGVQYVYGSDIFEFYREYQDRFRPEWNNLRLDWGSRFREIETSVVLDISISGSGMVGNYSPKAGGNGEANALP